MFSAISGALSAQCTSIGKKQSSFEPTWLTLNDMLLYRYRPGVAVVNNKIYVMGGEEGMSMYHDTVERYDPEKDRWEVIGHMPSARSWLACASLKVRPHSEMIMH